MQGKSGLKHTPQVLECWGNHPEWPRLMVIGRFTYQDAQRYLDKGNVVFMPAVSVRVWVCGWVCARVCACRVVCVRMCLRACMCVCGGGGGGEHVALY